MEGLLLIDKPKGWTSFDVVNFVRRIIASSEGKKPRQVKVGHTGTLDPMATGLLVLVIGKTYTKKVPELIKHDKTYEAEITFGVASTTGDAEGELISVDNAPVRNQKDVEAVLPQFIGAIEQTPPSYSAVMVNGKRAYELARKGETVDIASRTVKIFDITIESCTWPTVRIKTHVGSGTYIRVLAEDIAKALGTSGHLSRLRRTSVAQWSVDDAITPEELDAETIYQRLLA